MDIKKIIKQEQENKITRLANAMGFMTGSQISQTRFISDSTHSETYPKGHLDIKITVYKWQSHFVHSCIVHIILSCIDRETVDKGQIFMFP